MLKRWGTLPRGARWLVGGIAAVVLALAIGWVLFVPAADWLATHDVGRVTGSLRTLRLQAARDAARGRLLAFGVGLFAAAALCFTARTVILSREGQATDRYTKAVELLGSGKLDVRIGGIYALERVARGSPGDHPTVMEVLTVFIHEHSREQWPPAEPGTEPPPRTMRPDVQAAIAVVGRRNPGHDRQPVNLIGSQLLGADLSGANLTRADLSHVDLNGAHLARVNLTRAHLTGADLTGTDLTGAWLTRADLSGAYLTRAHITRAHLNAANLIGADLSGADLTGARLTRARLTRAHLTRAHLTDADLTGADLTGAYLSGAYLTRADLSGAYLTGANLTGADLTSADLTRADLTGAHLTRAVVRDTDLTGAYLTGASLIGADLTGTAYPEGLPVPEGWVQDPTSGRLSRASEDIEDADD